MYATDGTTSINGFGLGVALLMCLLMLVLPRRQALLPIIAMVCFMTMGQRLMVAGLNFTTIRVLLVFGLIRVVTRGEIRLGGLNQVDRAMIWWILSAIVTYTLLWKTHEAFVNRLGMAYDALGLFFLLRVLVRDLDDMRAVIRHFAWCIIPLAVFMLVEKQTGRNAFAVFGGVPPETIIRDGVLRCQGPFAHPILAGAFAAATVPLFLGLWAQKRGDALLAFTAIASAVTITICAGSSGPVLAFVAAIVGWNMFRFREHMSGVRRGIVLVLLTLHICMKAPVWFLLARMSVFDGSTGWHRSILIDHAIHHFPDWWLIGTYSTASWGYFMFDVTNTYVLSAVEGGLITLLLFFRVISRCFASAGIAVKTWGDEHRAEQKLAWALGCSLLVHATDFISVVYFDQNAVCWYLLLAMLSTCRMIPREALEPAVASEVVGPARGRRGGPEPRRGERTRGGRTGPRPDPHPTLVHRGSRRGDDDGLAPTSLEIAR